MLTPAYVQICFMLLVVITCTVVWLSREAAQGTAKETLETGVRKFRNLYLAVYFMAMFSDWLQGPYVYALYESYGISPSDNAMLFVAGFGSSMVFGTVVGSMADKTGRRKSALLYCLIYIVSCLTKHVSMYTVLMMGRVAGGIATSLLFSVFESWLVCEHHERGYTSDSLSETFSFAALWNSIAAISAGFVAQYAADFAPLSPPASSSSSIHIGGFCSPFDVSIICLMFCGMLIFLLWTENYGEKTSSGNHADVSQSMKEAVQLITGNPDILLCGLVSSLFEASMYVFVFQWTPAVSQEGQPKPPFGHIFSTFMVSCMLGSRVFSLASKYMTPQRIGQGVIALATATHLAVPMIDDPQVRFTAFLLFEMSVGIYFPMIGTLKSSIVPEASRATIYNLYRVPLNFLVIGALVCKASTKTAFTVTSILLGLALLAQSLLITKIVPEHHDPVPMQVVETKEIELNEPEILGAAIA